MLICVYVHSLCLYICPFICICTWSNCMYALILFLWKIHQINIIRTYNWSVVSVKSVASEVPGVSLGRDTTAWNWLWVILWILQNKITSLWSQSCPLKILQCIFLSCLFFRTKVTIIGIIREAQESATNITYKINDMTSDDIVVRKWIDNEVR